MPQSLKLKLFPRWVHGHGIDIVVGGTVGKDFVLCWQA